MRKNDRRGWFLLCCVLLFAPACPDSTNPSPTPPPSGDGGRLPPTRWRAAVGATGAFTQTFDENTWQARAVAGGDLYAVACVGNLLGWVVGANGFVARTDDGGASFRTIPSGLGGSLRAVRFADRQNGILAGDGGLLAVSNDGGEHFRIILPLTTQTLRGVAFAGGVGLAIAVGDSGVVLRSTDGANTFAKVPSFTSADLRAVASDAAATLILAVDSAGSTWGSRDRAQSFQLEATAPAALFTVALVAPPTALAAGARGTVMVRADNGKWTAGTIAGGTIDLNAALLTEEGGFAYIAGDGGVLLRSGDLGNTWHPIASGTSATLYGLEDL